MSLTYIEIPIDFGHTENGKYQPSALAAAPRYWRNQFQSVLARNGSETVSIKVAKPKEDESAAAPLKFDAEILRVIEPASEVVYRVTRSGDLPFVLGGDHTVSFATATGISRALPKNVQLGAIVFDAHTDFNLPGKVFSGKRGQEIPPGYTFSGNAHGMIHALLGKLGDSRSALAAFCKRTSHLNPSRIVVVGVRARRYPQLEETLGRAKPLLIGAQEIRTAGRNGDLRQILKHALAQATANFREPFYLSIDCDVLDPKEFPHVGTPVAKGLSFDLFGDCLDLLFEQKPLKRLLRGVDLSEAQMVPGKKHRIAGEKLTARLAANLAEVI